MIGTTARWLVPMLLSTIHAKHPKLRLVISEGSTLQLEPQLAAGRLDLAVLTYPVPGKDLSFESMFEEELVFVAPEDTELFPDKQRLTLADLGTVDLLLPAQGTPYRSELDAALRPAGVKLRPLAELDGVRLLASLTFEGFGPSVLPATAVPDHLRSRFKMIAIDGLPKRRVGLALRSRGLPSAPTRAVVAELKRLATSQRRLPQGLHAVLPESVTRTEGSWRSVGVPNG
jgi:DNA-binding transcriptional LysR family regulator